MNSNTSKEKKPNILIIVIDSLRNDQIFGENRTCVTPNIDEMISKGTYFSQTISSADGTILSLNGVLTGLFPFRTGTRAIKFNLQKNNFIQQLIDFGYDIFGFGPSLTSFVPFSKYFQNENSGYHAGPPAEPLSNELGDKILKLIDNLPENKPWLSFFHIEELHSLREGSTPVGLENFDDPKFGSTRYERIVSHIDFWIGKILDKINLNDTLVIFTSDHGERIPYGDIRDVEMEPTLKGLKNVGTKFLPNSSYKIGGKFLSKVRKPIGYVRQKNANKNLEPYQIRSRENYFTPSLFDELLRVPLIFYGYNTPKKIITQQVRNIDIFPTIFDLLNIKIKNKIDGQSLVPLFFDTKVDELPAYIQTIPLEKTKKFDKVGVRTNNYKFFVSSNDLKSEMHLFNLKNDPHENDNIASSSNELNRLKKILENFLQMQTDTNSIDSLEHEKISSELKKLGYM